MKSRACAGMLSITALLSSHSAFPFSPLPSPAFFSSSLHFSRSLLSSASRLPTSLSLFLLLAPLISPLSLSLSPLCTCCPFITGLLSGWRHAPAQDSSLLSPASAPSPLRRGWHRIGPGPMPSHTRQLADGRHLITTDRPLLVLLCLFRLVEKNSFLVARSFVRWCRATYQND